MAEKRIRNRKTGLVYGDIIDMGDHYLGVRPGSDHHVRIPRGQAVEVSIGATDEPVAPEKMTGGAVSQEELDRVKKEREGKKS